MYFVVADQPAKSSKCFLRLHECLDRNPKQSFRFETCSKPQQQYQQQQKWMEETSKWCDVVNGFDEAQVCLALGDYLNCKIHTCLGGKSVKDGIKVMKSGGSTELPSGRCWVSFTLVLPGDSEKNMRNVRKKWPRRCSHHFWNSWSSPFLRWFPCWSCGSSRNFPTK